MKYFLPVLCLFLFGGKVQAQIYADVTVSQNGNLLGTFRILLHHDKVPRTVANFVGLATGARAWIDPRTGFVREGVRYYDGLVFHRLDHDFVIQGGDPLGTGSGGPGFLFQDEFDPSLRHDGPYVVSMANSGVNSNGSQFFITFGAASPLDDMHSVFGTVINDALYPGSRSLIDGFTSTLNFPTDANESPTTPIVIESIAVSGPDLADFDINDPALGLPTVKLQWKRLEARTDGVFLVWNRQDRREYPVRVSEDLTTWNFAGNVLSMGAQAEAEIGVGALVNPATTFFSFPEVDYSHTPVLPQNIFQNGDTLALSTGGGTLTVVFNGTGGGSWNFDDGVGGNQSGAVTSTGVPSGTALPGIPDSGVYIASSGSYARALSAREVVIFFDQAVGPDQLTAIQPSLSFHTATSGWYNGPVNSNLPNPPRFKGSFVWTPAP